MNKDAITSIKYRRSTRKYLKENIKKDELLQVLDAGLMAPSAHNDKGWHLSVVTNQELLHKMNIETLKICEDCGDALYERWSKINDFNIFYNAPTVIVLSGKDSAYNSYIDCAAATQNMLIAAESLGLGTCWIGIIELLFREKTEEYRENLHLPRGYTPLFAMTLGYRDGLPAKPPVVNRDVINFIK